MILRSAPPFGDSGFTLRGDTTVNNLAQNLDSYGNQDTSEHGQNAEGIAIKFGSEGLPPASRNFQESPSPSGCAAK